jgi:C-3',4' desaturase CrtD
MTHYDIIVIGAGIAGLSAAALLAHDGYRVLLLEGHIEPGGCASSYERKRPDGSRYVFDVGATLFAGFQPGGAHHWVAEKLGIRWPVRPLEPAMDVLLPDERIRRWGDGRWMSERQRAFRAQSALAERFWHEQEQTAEIAWRFAARQPPMPPETLSDLLQLGLAIRPEMLRLLPGLPQTVGQRLHSHGITDRRLKAYIDGQLLISAQTGAAACSWLYGAVALDFARIGAHYVEGGAWSLARTLETAFTQAGGTVHYRQWVKQIVTDGGRVCGVVTEKGERFSANHVIGNLTLWDAQRLLGEAAPARLQQAIRAVPDGWGACMLYLGVDATAVPAGIAEHQQVIASYDQPLGEANSVFISIHPHDDLTRAPAGQLAITVSTHTRPERWARWKRDSVARYREEKEQMAERMLATVALALPNLQQHIRYRQIGTPVSFQRYTRRAGGQVGGFPQYLGNSGFFSLGPRAAGVGGLWLVGDSTFPGQSTAAVTQSAIRVYQAIRRQGGQKQVSMQLRSVR